MGKQHQQPARDRQVLLEMQELIAIAQLAVEQHGGGKAEARQQQRGGAGVIAANDQNAAAQLDGDGERQKLPGDAEGLLVSDSRRIGRKLAPGFVQEDRRQQEAADELRRLPEW